MLRFMILLISFILSINVSSVKLDLTDEAEWSHHAKLDEPNGVIVKWRNSPFEKDGSQYIIMEMSGNTSGYLGLGFSPNGAMTGADIIIGWVDSEGKGHIYDFHGVGNDMPVLDETQNYELLSSSETENGTTIRFRRKWNTCDENDMTLTNDTTKLIWSFGSNDPKIINDDQFSYEYHGTNRGTRSVFLAHDTLPAKFPDEVTNMDPNIKTWDVLMKNVTITNINTTYYCKMSKFEDTSVKHQFIGWKPIIQADNLKNVHHMTLFECYVPDNLIQEFESTANANKNGVTCFHKDMPLEWGIRCSGPLVIWFVGSEGEMLPNHVGAPLGREYGGATYFLSETHYENPEGRTIIDNSGIRIFYTDKLRQYDGAIMTLGLRHSPFLAIPPGQDNFMLTGICAPECFEKTLPSTGIHIDRTLLHAHLRGRRIRLRHFRNAKELPIVSEEGNYDFNYQQSRALNPEITVLPGDEFLTECNYESKDMKRFTLGGLATRQEMCFAFIFYYPKMNVTNCQSQTEFYDFMGALGITKVSGDVLKLINMPYDPKDSELAQPDDAKSLEETGDGTSYKNVYDQMQIEEPSELKGLTVGQHLRSMNWTSKEIAKKVQDSWNYGKHYQYCTAPGSKRVPLKNHDIVLYPDIREPLSKIETNEQCKLVASSSTNTKVTR